MDSPRVSSRTISGRSPMRRGASLRDVNIREVPGFPTEQRPFGGIKKSGLGAKEGVVEAIRGMTTVKLVTLPWG